MVKYLTNANSFLADLYAVIDLLLSPGIFSLSSVCETLNVNWRDDRGSCSRLPDYVHPAIITLVDAAQQREAAPRDESGDKLGPTASA